MDFRNRPGVRAFKLDDRFFGFEVHHDLTDGDDVARFDFNLGDVDGLHSVGNFRQFEFNGHDVFQLELGDASPLSMAAEPLWFDCKSAGREKRLRRNPKR